VTPLDQSFFGSGIIAWEIDHARLGHGFTFGSYNVVSYGADCWSQTGHCVHSPSHSCKEYDPTRPQQKLDTTQRDTGTKPLPATTVVTLTMSRS
jgi:hypothetical protein